MAPGSELESGCQFATTSQTLPVILEYIPYRKDDFTALRDSTTIAWFAEQSYVCVRVDMRGTGSSDGVLYDEYTEVEINDGLEVVDWLAKQPWCDGNVGTDRDFLGWCDGIAAGQPQSGSLEDCHRRRRDGTPILRRRWILHGVHDWSNNRMGRNHVRLQHPTTGPGVGRRSMAGIYG